MSAVYPLSTFAWTVATFFMLFLSAGAVAIGIDLWLARTGRNTISRFTVNTFRKYPIAVALVLLGLSHGVVFAIGALFGHLVIYQTVSP